MINFDFKYEFYRSLGFCKGDAEDMALYDSIVSKEHYEAMERNYYEITKS